ncbi:hypothetical protein HQQ80_01815 [Microbacteriaceae bacterium VKM Ac-2855]|nr:hypothetical protein [Microbacteriaceae bacterium VKM Ac-2855]
MISDPVLRARIAQLEASLSSERGDALVLRDSWQRSAAAGVNLSGLETVFVGSAQGAADLEVCARDLLDEEPPMGVFSILVLDAGGVVRSRRDGDAALARLLDALSVSPGFDMRESQVGTTALSLALSSGRDACLPGELNFHPQLAGVTNAAAVVIDEETALLHGCVWVLSRNGRPEDLLLAYARVFAHSLARRLSAEDSRRSRAVFDRFVRFCAQRRDWVVGTDGNHAHVSDSALRLDPEDLKVLTDRAAEAFVLREAGDSEAVLPSGTLLDLKIEAVSLEDEIVGVVLAAAPCVAEHGGHSEASRRQGAHVTNGVRRDYASAFRGDAEVPAGHPIHSLESGRDHRDLLTPFARARHDVAASVRAHRDHLLIGEAGSGKRALVGAEFRVVHPQGRIFTADCAQFTGDTLPIRSSSGALFHGAIEDGPSLLLLGGLDALTPLASRRLDEILRTVTSGAARPLLVGSINDVTVDASKPYGLVMRYFHETIRVPPLRLRVEEIGDIAREVLGSISGGRSLRLGPQATRVLEGYSWPGNVNEFEDVLRYVVARKPVGEIQARDLPASCFNGRSRRLSLLEAAQCDAIIQALYEAKGNRYKAAAALGIARSSLYRKINAFGISYIG